MAVNINWNALQPRDFGAGAVQYAQAGQEARQQQAKQNALAMYAENPDGAAQALLAAGDLQSANALQQYGAQAATSRARASVAPLVAQGKYGEAAKGAAGSSPEYAAQLLKLDDAQRAAVGERASVLGSAAFSLKSIPPEARPAALQQMAPQLQAAGIPPEQLASFDPSDQNLEIVIGQAMSLKEHVDKAQADRTFTAGRQDAADRQADRIADNERQARADAAREAAANAREGRLLAAVNGGGAGGQRWEARTAADGTPYLENTRTGDRKADPSAKAGALRVVPAKVSAGLAENRTSLNKIDRALNLIDQYPKGMGLMNKLGDDIRQRTDSEGINVRAAVADIGSQKLHDRSGASVTVGEAPRLMPFIPKVDDTPEAAKKKLRLLRYEYESMVNETEQLYAEENGYRPVGGAEPRAASQAAPQRPSAGPPASAPRKAAPASTGWKIIR